jgi:hypothetical protein
LECHPIMDLFRVYDLVVSTVTETAGGLPAKATAVRDTNPAISRAAGDGTDKRLLMAPISRQYV